METITALKFKTEWTEKDFRIMEKAIINHFRNRQQIYRGKDFIIGSYKQLDELFGLAYTSTGVHANYGICNGLNVVYDNNFNYEFFIMTEEGVPYAELWDKDENEKYIPL